MEIYMKSHKNTIDVVLISDEFENKTISERNRISLRYVEQKLSPHMLAMYWVSILPFTVNEFKMYQKCNPNFLQDIMQ